MLTVQNLSKQYDQETILEGVNLELEPGRIHLLTGANGSGKTTFLHLLVGLRQPDTGEVRWNDDVVHRKDPRGLQQYRSRLGFLPQNATFPAHSTLNRLANFYARLRDVPSDQVQDWFRKVQLAGDMDQEVQELSGGMKRRLGLALTLFHEPDLVVLDEPENNLDPDWRERLRSWLQTRARDGVLVISTTQLLREWDENHAVYECTDATINLVDPNP